MIIGPPHRLLRRPRRLAPHDKGMQGATVPGRGFMTWDELHELAKQLNRAFDRLPKKQRKRYSETGQLE